MTVLPSMMWAVVSYPSTGGDGTIAEFTLSRTRSEAIETWCMYYIDRKRARWIADRRAGLVACRRIYLRAWGDKP